MATYDVKKEMTPSQFKNEEEQSDAGLEFDTNSVSNSNCANSNGEMVFLSNDSAPGVGSTTNVVMLGDSLNSQGMAARFSQRSRLSTSNQSVGVVSVAV